jgi:hypothetical protein
LVKELDLDALIEDLQGQITIIKDKQEKFKADERGRKEANQKK